MNETGVKHDDDKPRCGLVLLDFHCALWEVSRVGTFGARKYSDSNWLNVENGVERYTDAMLRHLLAGRHKAGWSLRNPRRRFIRAICCFPHNSELDRTLPTTD